MTIADTTTPTRSRRPTRSRKAPARWRRHQRLLIPRGRLRPVPLADVALHELMQSGDIYKIGRSHYLVAPIDAELLETLIVAAGATEDDEPSLAGGHPGRDALPDGELGADDEGEPSLGQSGADLEADGIEDGDFSGRGEGTLGWTNEGSQLSLGVPQEDEAEPELGWNNGGMHLQLVAGYEGGSIRESDGDCDREEDDPPGGNVDDEPHDPEGSLL
jgi:hypothetical protein